MSKTGRHKNRTPIVPVAADSSSSESSSESDDDPFKNLASNPNPVSFDWETCTKEEQLEKIIRKKLEHLFGEVLSTLVHWGYDEDVALKALLESGYCVGECDCMRSVIENCVEFLTRKEFEKSEEHRPEPFQNLHLLVEFNLHFMVYVLQKCRPNLNRLCICRLILLTDLNLSRAIIMNSRYTPFDITDMPTTDLNLEDNDGDSGDKYEFLTLEIIEMLVKLNILDKFIPENRKYAMIAALQKPIEDLKPQLQERIRWASKKFAQARRKQPSIKMSLGDELRVYLYYSESRFAKKESELLSIKNEFDLVKKTGKHLEVQNQEIKSEISASKLIVSELNDKLLEVSKKGQLKDSKKQKAELLEEIKLEKENTSEWELYLVMNEAAIIEEQVKMDEVTKTRKAAATQVYSVYRASLDKWNLMVDDLKFQTNEDRLIYREHTDRHNNLIKDSTRRVRFELLENNIWRHGEAEKQNS